MICMYIIYTLYIIYTIYKTRINYSVNNLLRNITPVAKCLFELSV